jgi:hypothetical protein
MGKARCHAASHSLLFLSATRGDAAAVPLISSFRLDKSESKAGSKIKDCHVGIGNANRGEIGASSFFRREASGQMN